MRTRIHSKQKRGLALLECLVYVSLMVFLFGLAFGAFLETLHHSTELERLTLSTVRALQSGEQWREDIRAARAEPRLVRNEGRDELQIKTANGEIGYAFRDDAVLRRSSAGGPWLPVLDGVKVCRFAGDQRKQVLAWRWELELIRRKDEGLRRVFTFQAVPPAARR